MKSLLLALSISIITIGNSFATTYYVSVSGHDTASGLSPANAWKTLGYAAGSSSPVIAGDTVYIKAGNYGAENVVFQKSGTSGHPILFQGYQNTPGDLPPVLVSNPNPYASFVSTDMPTFDGGDRTTGMGFNCEHRQYLAIKNFQIQNYAYGFFVGDSLQPSGNLVLNNINVMSVGNINLPFSGEGILLGSKGTKFSNNNTLINCQVVNAASEGFGINGDTNTFIGCRTFCNENTSNASTDNYMIVCGNYNTFRNCYIERTAGLTELGQGYSAITNADQVVDLGAALPAITAQYNKFYHCTAKNMGASFCVRDRNSRFNLFYHCKAIGTHTGAAGSPGGEGDCIVTMDGASDNIFDGCVAENCNAAFTFEDTFEDGDTGTNPTGHPGNYNRYMNCLAYNCYVGVNFSNYNIQSDAGDNTIANCTFFKTRYLYYAARHCANMKYVGNIYYGCLPATPGGEFVRGADSLDVIPNGTTSYFKNCDFINIEGGMPANFVANSIGSIGSDPLFIDTAALDFHLKPESPCVDASISIAYITTDFDSIPRPQGINYDMGAFEAQVTTSAPSYTSLKNNVSVYPNPTSDELNIISGRDISLITLFDILGNKIISIQTTSIKTELSMQNIPNGIYLLKIENDRSTEMIKVIKNQ